MHKILTPDGERAHWSAELERKRLAMLRDDDRFAAQRHAERTARFNAMVREGAAGGEIVAFMGAGLQAERERQLGISLSVPLFYSKRGKPIYPIAGAAERLMAIQNSSQATTAAPVKQPSGTSIRTMQQIECVSTLDLTVVQWAISCDGTTSTNVPGQVELFGTTVAATMSTAAVSADVTLYNQPAGTGTQIVFGGTTHTGFATAAVTEGTVANYRLADLQMIPPTGGYASQWPLGREFTLPASKLLRCRVTFANTVNLYIIVFWGEN